MLAPPVYYAGQCLLRGLVDLQHRAGFVWGSGKLDARYGQHDPWDDQPTTYHGGNHSPTPWSPPVILPPAASPLLVVNTGQGVTAFDLESGQQVAEYYTPGLEHGVTVDSALLLYDGGCLFQPIRPGCSMALDANLNPVAGSTLARSPTARSNPGCGSCRDADGSAVVIFGDPVTDNLNFYSTASNNLAALATNQTWST